MKYHIKLISPDYTVKTTNGEIVHLLEECRTNYLTKFNNPLLKGEMCPFGEFVAEKL